MTSTESARARILRAALHLLGTVGMPAVTNRRIAKTAGVSLGSITYHFASQDELLNEALEQFLGEEVERLGQLATSLTDATLTAEEAAQALEELLQTRTELRAAKLQLYVHAIQNAGVRDAVRECFEAYDLLAQRALEAMHVPDAASVAPFLIATIDGLQLRRLATGAEDFPVAAPLRRLLDGLH